MADADQPTTPDADLVAAVLAGNAENAFDELVRRYERCARATCYGVLRDWHLARDAAQEGFVAAYANLRLLRQPASFGAWLLTIMRHRATNTTSQFPTLSLNTLRRLVCSAFMQAALIRGSTLGASA